MISTYSDFVGYITRGEYTHQYKKAVNKPLICIDFLLCSPVVRLSTRKMENFTC